MKVKELIEKLSKVDPEIDVFIDDIGGSNGEIKYVYISDYLDKKDIYISPKKIEDLLAEMKVLETPAYKGYKMEIIE